MDTPGRFSLFIPASSSRVTIRSRGYLPHWEAKGATYFVTYRLGDSLPAEVRRQIAQHRTALEAAKQTGRKLLPIEAVVAHRLSNRKIEEYLDAGCGECILKRPECAAIVAESLDYFDGKRYENQAWCVMPNHVHALFRVLDGHNLAKIVYTWKRFTSCRINSALGRHGSLWEREYFDHLIRNQAEFVRAVDYIRNNPVRAGLVGWRWVYVRRP
jgi:REP element-mobilizing transposase RayT